MRQTDLDNKNRLASIFQNFGLGELVMVENINHGACNDTYLVHTNNDKYIFQKIHKDFSFELLEDIDVVTKYLEQKGGGSSSRDYYLAKMENSVMEKDARYGGYLHIYPAGL